MKITLLLFSLIIFFSYLIYVYKNHGILSSISASYYVIKHKILFLLWTWGSALPLIILGEHGLSFFAGGFLMFVGVASNTRVNDKMVSVIHIVGATGAIILGYLFLWFDLHLWWLVLISLVPLFYMYLTKLKNHTWWIEVLAYMTVIIGLLIKI